MGFFSDKCEALIDPSTGRVLQGEALAQAKQDPKTPRCGHRVKKAARFCSKCGAGAPGGWTQCPGCGKWVGNESSFCWNCKTALHPDTRNAVAGGRWQREAGTFAQRVEVGDIRRLLKDGLIVETGTAALLLDAGAFKDILDPGRHTLESLARKINWWGDPPPRTVVLVDNGDVVVPIRVTDLRTAEEIPVECYTEVCLHFQPKRAEPFLANFMKTALTVSYEDLANVLAGEVRATVSDAASTSTVEDLVKDPQRRVRLEDALREALKVSAERYGLELVRLASVEFTGKEYEQLREQAGVLEVKRRELEFQQRMREALSGDRMQQFKTEHDLAEYVSQLAQEKDVSSEMREHEMARLKQAHRHEIDKAEASYQMAKEMDQAAHQIGIKIKWDDYTAAKLLKDAELQARIAAIKVDEEIRQTNEWLKVRAAKMAQRRQDERERAEIYAGKDIQTLIALIPDAAHRDQLLALHRQTLRAGQSPEQLLAEAAGQSTAAAEALARMRELKREDLEREFNERKKLSDESAARLERVLSDALKAMSEFSKHGGSSQTINKIA
jgi:hypothetical protein